MSQSALPILRTPRLTLRPLRHSDADALVAGVGNFDVSKWLAVVPYPYDRSDAEWFLNRVFNGNRQVWAICDDRGLVGLVGIEDELGYWLARPAWGRGYAFEAARAAVGFWFETRENHSLAAGVFDGNTRSDATLRALGFLETGRAPREARALSQTVMSTRLALTRARWEARQSRAVTTPRLTLRAARVGDATAIAALTTTGWTPARIAADLALGGWRGAPGTLLVIARDQRLIGWIGLGGAPLSIDFALAPACRGQGFMTEALTAVLPDLFDRFPVTRIRAHHPAETAAPGAFLTKLGFSRSDHTPDTSTPRLEPLPVITYAITRDSLKDST